MIHKIDSSTYSIIARGAGIRPLRDVENAFLKKAGQYLNSFEYYFESSQYGYTAPAPIISTSHTGFMVYGIVQGTDSSQSVPIKLENKPFIFKKEFPSFSTAFNLE